MKQRKQERKMEGNKDCNIQIKIKQIIKHLVCLLHQIEPLYVLRCIGHII